MYIYKILYCLLSVELLRIHLKNMQVTFNSSEVG